MEIHTEPCHSQVQHLHRRQGLGTGKPARHLLYFAEESTQRPEGTCGLLGTETQEETADTREKLGRDANASPRGPRRNAGLAGARVPGRRRGRGEGAGARRGGGARARAHLERGTAGRAHRRRGSSGAGHSTAGWWEGPRRPVPAFLRLRRAGSADDASSCRQRLSARRLGILGVSRRLDRAGPRLQLGSRPFAGH